MTLQFLYRTKTLKHCSEKLSEKGKKFNCENERARKRDIAGENLPSWCCRAYEVRQQKTHVCRSYRSTGCAPNIDAHSSIAEILAHH